MSVYFLYGPPGTGKTTLGKALARRLQVPFLDLDADMERAAGLTVAELFQREGEASFRVREKAALVRAAQEPGERVVALGGGALLDDENRRLAETAGPVLLLEAPEEVIRWRVSHQGGKRPLLEADDEGGDRLNALLRRRAAHYAAFPRRLQTGSDDVARKVEAAQQALGAFQVRAMGAGYPVRVRRGGAAEIGTWCRTAGWSGRVALVTDVQVAALPIFRTAEQALVREDFTVVPIVLPAGESGKTIAAVQQLWAGFLAGGLERGSAVLALGGGVVSDLAGFAAATYLRGVKWAVLPTTLLAMVDASLGGKTGADLPEGKNLVGAFHSPSLVLADPDALMTLPDPVFRSGLAEVVKHGILDDPGLFAWCEQGWTAVRDGDRDALVRQAMAVKIRTIEADPYETGVRASLNLGHTIGHAVEQAMGYALDHGAAVSIGLVAEARLAERMGLAEAGLAARIRAVLEGLGLPVELPGGLDRAAMRAALRRDKKKAAGAVRFALPVRIGDVRVGVAVDPALLETV